MLKKITRCRVCHGNALAPVLDLGEQALTGRFPYPSDQDPLSGPLELVACEGECCLLQLRHSYPLGEMYGETYGYRSSNNATMRRHLERKIAELVALARPRAGDGVLDIGCNDGTTLRCYDGLGLRRAGIDPSSGRYQGEYPPDVRLIVDFFSAAAVRAVAGDSKYKIVTSIAMFYDLEDPLGFMRQVADLLEPDGVWETEQAYMPAMLERCAYDSVCHEHLSYFSLRQLKWMGDRSGLKIVGVGFNDINGGSFFVRFALRHSVLPEAVDEVRRILGEEARGEYHSGGAYGRFAERVAGHRRGLVALLERARREGRTVLGYGASTKGNVILQYCGITPDLLPAIAEKYPMKYGRVTPGTRIPIESEAEAKKRNPAAFLVLPWYFRDEILERERAFLKAGGEMILVLPDLEVVRH